MVKIAYTRQLDKSIFTRYQIKTAMRIWSGSWDELKGKGGVEGLTGLITNC